MTGILWLLVMLGLGVFAFGVREAVRRRELNKSRIKKLDYIVRFLLERLLHRGNEPFDADRAIERIRTALDAMKWFEVSCATLGVVAFFAAVHLAICGDGMGRAILAFSLTLGALFLGAYLQRTVFSKANDTSHLSTTGKPPGCDETGE